MNQDEILTLGSPVSPRPCRVQAVSVEVSMCSLCTVAGRSDGHEMDAVNVNEGMQDIIQLMPRCCRAEKQEVSGCPTQCRWVRERSNVAGTLLLWSTGKVIASRSASSAQHKCVHNSVALARHAQAHLPVYSGTHYKSSANTSSTRQGGWFFY